MKKIKVVRLTSKGVNLEDFYLKVNDLYSELGDEINRLRTTKDIDFNKMKIQYNTINLENSAFLEAIVTYII